jgi:hypothetical protein
MTLKVISEVAACLLRQQSQPRHKSPKRADYGYTRGKRVGADGHALSLPSADHTHGRLLPVGPFRIN